MILIIDLECLGLVWGDQVGTFSAKNWPYHIRIVQPHENHYRWCLAKHVSLQFSHEMTESNGRKHQLHPRLKRFLSHNELSPDNRSAPRSSTRPGWISHSKPTSPKSLTGRWAISTRLSTAPDAWFWCVTLHPSALSFLTLTVLRHASPVSKTKRTSWEGVPIYILPMLHLAEPSGIMLWSRQLPCSSPKISGCHCEFGELYISDFMATFDVFRSPIPVEFNSFTCGPNVVHQNQCFDWVKKFWDSWPVLVRFRADRVTQVLQVPGLGVVRPVVALSRISKNLMVHQFPHENYHLGGFSHFRTQPNIPQATLQKVPETDKNAVACASEARNILHRFYYKFRLTQEACRMKKCSQDYYPVVMAIENSPFIMDDFPSDHLHFV